MRLPPGRPAVLASLCLALLACGHGMSAGQCQHNFDCPAGQGCESGTCKVLPCGGCQPDQACGADGNCIAAQGASCSDHTCPSAYPCKGIICSRACTLDKDCDTSFICNSKIGGCAECVFDSQCESKPGR